MRYRSIGAFSAEFLESGNKWWKLWASNKRAGKGGRGAGASMCSSKKAMDKMHLTTHLRVQAGKVQKKVRGPYKKK